MLKVVNTLKAPAAIGPYSQGIILKNILFSSGQIPASPETGEIVGTDITAQAEQVMENVKAILDEAGTCFENVVKTTCFLSDMADFAEFNKVYEKYFVSKPARSCVAVKALPKNVLCEVEVIGMNLFWRNTYEWESKKSKREKRDHPVSGSNSDSGNDRTAGSGICGYGLKPGGADAGISCNRRRDRNLSWLYLG